MAVLLSACSSHVKINETWKAPDTQTMSYKKLLVIGITQSHNLRKSFENIFSQTLSDHGVAAVPSHKLISDLSKADSVQIQQLARQEGADAVVITRVLSRSEHTSYVLATGHLEQRTVIMNKADPNSSTTVAMSAVGLVPGEMDAQGATLQTNFFDAESADLIWVASSNATATDDKIIDVCWKLSALLTQALGQDHLVELNSAKFRQPSL